MTPEPVSPPPVRKQLVVRCRRDLAFEVFTARMTQWWPLAQFSIGGPEAVGVTLEPRAGGRIYETCADGSEHLWGQVIHWDPPSGFDCTWHPGRRPSEAQTLSLRFDPVGPSETRVLLEHHGWEALADEAAAVRSRYDNGWEVVFGECFASAAEAAPTDES